MELLPRVDAEYNIKIPHKSELVKKHSEYEIECGTEYSDPHLVKRAQQIQGYSYLTAGFVYESALDEEGRLHPELDRSRGSNVLYYLAKSRLNDDREASLRKIDAPEQLDDMAAYKYCKGVIHSSYDRFLRSAHEDPDKEVKEIAALSITTKDASAGSFELIRQAWQDAIRSDKDEVWLMTFAPRAHAVLSHRFGEHVIEEASEETIEVDSGDERTNSQLRLVPVVVDTQRVLHNINKARNSALDEGNTAQARVYARTMQFMADGLEDEHLIKALPL